MMRLAIAMITYNRAELLTQTVESLKQGGHDYGLVLIDNGSTDPAARAVAAGHGAVRVERGLTIGAAKNAAITAALEVCQPDIILSSDDDHRYAPGALSTLMRFWSGLPDDIVLVCLHMESVYGWNTVRGVMESGGVKALIRDSVPGGAWSFRARDWPLIGPLPDRTGGEDTAAITRLAGQGYRFAALNLTVHLGEGKSLAGTRPPKGEPVDLRAWGVL